MSDFTSLQSSLLLGSLSLIPNNTLRYVLVALFGLSALVHAIHLQRPSIQLARVELQVKETEEIIQYARSFCPAKDFLSLGEQAVWLLEVKRTVSIVKCHILESKSGLSWKKYRLLSKDIALCVLDVQKIRAAVELVVETENQRRFTESINETESLLAGFRALFDRAPVVRRSNV
ncbi:hypothetical protein FB45DRAFT_1052610 [Roridomyces roridus]|uniref:Uncharacterized protein n=1 Tax=Roridomyces roridus TaxID=1738132 RepID=A0AAD7CA99_9AGAR|nr:hypothetical protein FB45DRAFT_1052610 [Roridomyces roridus]